MNKHRFVACSETLGHPLHTFAEVGQRHWGFFAQLLSLNLSLNLSLKKPPSMWKRMCTTTTVQVLLALCAPCPSITMYTWPPPPTTALSAPLFLRPLVNGLQGSQIPVVDRPRDVSPWQLGVATWCRIVGQREMRRLLVQQAEHMSAQGLAQKFRIPLHIHTHELCEIAKALHCLHRPATRMPQDPARRERLEQYFANQVLGLPAAAAAAAQRGRA